MSAASSRWASASLSEPGWNTGTSWAHDYASDHGWDGNLANLTFEHLAGLEISPPPVAYITDPTNSVGSGAPDEILTNVAYGYNWIFGDTMANYVSGMEGFVVNNYYVTVDFPVHNVTLGIDYGNIHAAVADAVEHLAPAPARKVGEHLVGWRAPPHLLHLGAEDAEERHRQSRESHQGPLGPPRAEPAEA